SATSTSARSPRPTKATPATADRRPPSRGPRPTASSCEQRLERQAAIRVDRGATLPSDERRRGPGAPSIADKVSGCQLREGRANRARPTLAFRAVPTLAFRAVPQRPSPTSSPAGPHVATSPLLLVANVGTIVGTRLARLDHGLRLPGPDST